jgi:hypothetical protein
MPLILNPHAQNWIFTVAGLYHCRDLLARDRTQVLGPGKCQG